jgi:hypothetical protein
MAFDYVNARIYLPEFYRKSEILLTTERVLSYKSGTPLRIFVPFRDLFGIEAHTVHVNSQILDDDWGWAVVQRTRELVHKDLEGCEDALSRANILAQQGKLTENSLRYTKERGGFQVYDDYILHLLGFASLFDRVQQLKGVNKAWLKEQYSPLPEIARFIDSNKVSGDNLRTALERAVTIWEFGEKIQQDGI